MSSYGFLQHYLEEYDLQRLDLLFGPSLETKRYLLLSQAYFLIFSLTLLDVLLLSSADIHNLREEAGVDIIMKLPTKNWKIGIQIEATIDIAEIKKEERTSFLTKILSKITDSTQYNLDLFVILFCIDITVDSYDKTLGITISRLEKLPIENFLYIRPENLINFFNEFNESKII